jgi:hypothetical protein
VLELYRLVDGRYELMIPDQDGRVWCPDLGVGFAWDESARLVRVLAPSGRIMSTSDEEAKLRQAAEERAEAAEQTAATERERAEALAAELERLRRALEADRGTSGTDQP